MLKYRLIIILLTLPPLALGSITLVNAQDKPPLLLQSSTREYKQKPPPPQQERVAPLVHKRSTLPLPPPPPTSSESSTTKNISDNAPIAVTTVKKAKMYFSMGKVSRITAPRGEIELKATVLYDETVVAVLHFNPEDGSLLPLGIRPAVYGTTSSIDKIKRNLPEIIHKLVVLQGAEYREHESSWIVPLAYHGMIVTHIKVYADGIHIVPDYPANHKIKIHRR